MGELKNNWLVAIHKKYWCKHAFNSYLKCDVLMNNLYDNNPIVQFYWLETNQSLL